LLRADVLLRAYVLLCAHVLGEHSPSRNQVMLSDGIIRLYRRWAREQQNSANDGGRETCDRRDARTNRIRATNATLSWASGRLTEYLRHARWARAGTPTGLGAQRRQVGVRHEQLAVRLAARSIAPN